MSEKWVYAFRQGSAEGHGSMKVLLGGKGANLADMSSLNLPVPAGFTVTTNACVHYFQNQAHLPDGLASEVEINLKRLEQVTGKGFGNPGNPLLVSVRSGARASMPGMMDTVLNLGLNDTTVEGLAVLTGDRRFALDCYRRFIAMYANVVLGIGLHRFEQILGDHKIRLEVTADTQVTADGWHPIIADYKAMIQSELGSDFPQEPRDQLWRAVKAVFGSWMNDRAKFYRKMHAIPEDWGTAVTIQSMVFGNMGETSATGVAFTRNPSNGDADLYGEFLLNAQGEDVVAGIRTPQALTRKAREDMGQNNPSMEEQLPAVFSQFKATVATLETHYRDMQDVEFTIEQGTLYILQTRNAKRTARAALKIAVEMASEGLITPAEAVLRIDPASLDQLLHPMLDPAAEKTVIAKGLPTSPGAASGKIVFTADDAVRLGEAGEAVILVRDDTSPEDIRGMHAARAVVTARGGMTSHAAVVARGMGRPCVSGVEEMHIHAERREFVSRGQTFRHGDLITLDGSTGEIIKGLVRMIDPVFSQDFHQIMAWSSAYKTLAVRANAETPADARIALAFGAEGIGLCRTEHMFFDAERITAVREMILADDETGRRKALARIEPMQRQDFTTLFEVMDGLPVTIRLLDPPLHEFLPHTEDDVNRVAAMSGIGAEKLHKRTKELSETNPMLGWRGCRLAMTFPEIYESQLSALFNAAVDRVEAGGAVLPEIMHPLVATREEMANLVAMTHAIAKSVFETRGKSVAYQTGTMIELPRAALLADRLAETAEFFSFGTNDLTQTTYGISRDDAGRFLKPYIEKGIFERDPFVSLDQDGVGALIRIAREKGNQQRPSMKMGMCGEHGGDPASIAFCHQIGLSYVSCSPFRIPGARLAAAQAALLADETRKQAP